MEIWVIGIGICTTGMGFHFVFYRVVFGNLGDLLGWALFFFWEGRLLGILRRGYILRRPRWTFFKKQQKNKDISGFLGFFSLVKVGVWR